MTLSEYMHGDLDDIRDHLNRSPERLEPQEIECVLINIIDKIARLESRITSLSYSGNE